MQIKKYIYFFSYAKTEADLCKLEARYIFKEEEKNKLLFSDIKVEPSSCAFVNKRLDIISFSDDYTDLINEINNKRICIEGFKVEYIVFDGDKTPYAERLTKLKDIGYSIQGYPDYHHPTVTYALGCYEGVWCFGLLIKDHFDWYKHKNKPHSYSHSISMSIAKALVNIAAWANKEKMLLDACCGVGTIMLEACFAGYTIEGCDINPKICYDAKENLSHFNYTANIYNADIKDMSKRYEAAIIDLPYNLMSNADENDMFHIIKSTAEITDRLVVVSVSDISNLISHIGFRIVDYCIVSKSGKRNFARKIWVCERNIMPPIVSARNAH